MLRSFLFFAFLAVGVTADLWTKDAAFDSLQVGQRHEVVEGFFFIAPARNPGAMWSLLQDVPAMAWVVVRGFIALCLLIYYLRTRDGMPAYAQFAFACVLAGALGNLHDNIWAEGGMVRDFIMCLFGDWAWPTFNIADSLICVGAILLLIYFLRLEDPAVVKKRDAVAETAAREAA